MPVFLMSILGFNAIPAYVARTILEKKPEVFEPCIKSFHETTQFRKMLTLALGRVK